MRDSGIEIMDIFLFKKIIEIRNKAYFSKSLPHTLVQLGREFITLSLGTRLNRVGFLGYIVLILAAHAGIHVYLLEFG